MLKAKSNEKSDEFKDDGNIFYKRFEFYNSLMSYNKVFHFFLFTIFILLPAINKLYL